MTVSKAAPFIFCALLFSISCRADEPAGWQLNNELSKVSFVSIKAADIGEVHSFTRLQGSLTDAGDLRVVIQLASVETLIPIRNERMQEMLFETGLFPTASVTAKLDAQALAALQTGDANTAAVEATLSLKDRDVPLTLQVIAARAGDNRLLVSSLQPIVLNAAAVGLDEGVEKLREVAGLPSISQAVPVSVVLTFDR